MSTKMYVILITHTIIIHHYNHSKILQYNQLSSHECSYPPIPFSHCNSKCTGEGKNSRSTFWSVRTIEDCKKQRKNARAYSKMHGSTRKAHGPCLDCALSMQILHLRKKCMVKSQKSHGLNHETHGLRLDRASKSHIPTKKYAHSRPRNCMGNIKNAWTPLDHAIETCLATLKR